MNGNETGTGSSVATIAEEVLADLRVPRATYRLQFNRGFTLRDAQTIVSYLHDLGISDCYASPLMKTRSDSTHGYDISDHSQLNPDLGSEDDLAALSRALRKRGMGLILDVVSNHMSIGDASNTWWMDVLENGPSSIYASYFDIDWHPVTTELENKVLLPILEDQYGKVLESGKLQLTYENGAFLIHYHEMKLPVAPRTYSDILSHQLDALADAMGKENEALQEFRSIITALNYLPPRTETDSDKVTERNREKEVIKRRIASLYEASQEVRAAIDNAVQAFNGTVGNPHSFDMLDALIDAQAYRLAFWRVAAEEINYRRFFDINDLAAVRVEQPEVFAATHQLVLRLLKEGKITGTRIDHADGLWDPSRYLRQLQESYLLHQVQARFAAQAVPKGLEEDVAAWFADRIGRSENSPSPWPLYSIAEKILSEGESLPLDWAVYGTTGYDFLGMVNGLSVDSRNAKAFDRVYGHFIGEQIDFRNLVNSSKKMAMLVSLVSEVNALSHQLERIAEKNRLYRDFTLNGLTFAIREIIAALPVYRAYVTGLGTVTRRDEMYVEAAVEEAKKRNPRTAEEVFDFIRDILLLRSVQDFREEDHQRLTDFAMKFQQVTGPVMAKGVEDTVFYVYNRLGSLNEVGSNPEGFGVSVRAFHEHNASHSQFWPHSLLATSTHDTKRSEDVRARINVLSEIPDEWRAALSRWSRLNAHKKTMVNGQPAPERNDEYLLYQTLLGAWPQEPTDPANWASFRERVAAYVLKALREAKVHTSWVNPNEGYEAAVRDFVFSVLADGAQGPFLDDFRLLQRRVAYFGQFNALAQVLLKLTCPGVPDIYQGTELWDFSLVDPDNRRTVDYEGRQSMLTELISQEQGAGEDLTDLVRELLDSSQDGRIKLYLIHRTLNYRCAHEMMFRNGAYMPFTADGPKADHLCAFARMLGDEAILVAVPRLVVGLAEGREQPPLGQDIWKDTRLTLPAQGIGRSYRNLYTGEMLSTTVENGTATVPLAELFSHFPVALLEAVGG
ncbi:MAG: malto-oligosyltrehalose synthase [Chloroflexota bacterium]